MIITNYVLYIKSAEEIKDFLALLNAPKAVLKITDVMISNEIVNDANRKRNCDMANLSKSVVANEKYASRIKFIAETLGLDELPEDLKTVAVARLENTTDTLSELAEKLGITKSCLNHRLRKLASIADELE